MSDNRTRNLHILLFCVTLAGVGTGIYTIYEYQRVKKINETVVTLQDAEQIIRMNAAAN